MIGANNVVKNLENSIKIMSKTETESLIEVGQRGVDILKEEAGVFENPTGRLRGSMSYTIDNKVATPIWHPTNKSGDKLNRQRADNEVDIGTNVIYAPSVEYLAQNGSAGFMLRAYKQTKSIAEKILKTNIKAVFK